MFDDDYASSEVYRLMPPPKKSELREALDAATGKNAEPELVVISPEIHQPRLARARSAVRRSLPWLGNLGNATLPVVLGTLIAAAILAAHLF